MAANNVVKVIPLTTGRMVIDQSQSVDGNNLTISIHGKFTFTDNNDFHKVIDTISSGKYSRVTFDLSDTEFMDSAALGMLLIVKAEANCHNTPTILHNPVNQPRKVLETGRFFDIFSVT